ncbi:DUF922 domain-containing protein [Reichenbachiella ulvae]|uniref:DUF922 domain-containing protein n=1 Tax=Reichenbachiella ulvae TaxID=2980104 RepID=A0ABT3CUT5_9BACT|nr:DUF922 domain-containing protein [Reichenbachiella ulvae]MCV9387438.1 DUF922 domain-containing protein [Reichenbachiella ulvae]
MRVITFFFLSLNSFVVQGQSEPQNDSLIYWDERELEWSDFTARVGLLEEIMGEAISYCTVLASTIDKDSCLYYEIYTVFNTNHSWVSGIQSSELLRHEQLHFDIVELHSRKIRKAIIDGVTQGDSQEEVGKRITSLINEVSVVQNDYDDETLHGQDADRQQEWVTKVRDSLKQYESYSSPTGNVFFPTSQND